MVLVKEILIVLSQVLSFAILIRALLSWFAIRPDNPLMLFLFQITEPILAPLRRLIPLIGGALDITPMVAILLLQLLSRLLSW